MNSFCSSKSLQSGKGSTMENVRKQLFQPDISNIVSKSWTVAKENLNQSQFDEMQNQIWKRYCINLCKFELTKYRHICELKEDPKFTKERRYYVSTEARRMFKKLMVLKCFEGTPIPVVDIASTLHISHKAASDIVKDSLAFDTIDEDIIEGRKRYMAKNWWAESLMQNGALFQYVQGEGIVRSRFLYTEFARCNSQQQIETQFNI